LYATCAAAVPVVDSLVAKGMSVGGALAFLITGPGTSAPALAAVLALSNRRVFLIYLTVLVVGALVLGYSYNLFF